MRRQARTVVIGHTVVVASSSATTLPGGFQSSYENATSGYDWLCLFGYVDYSGIEDEIINFIYAGGKVFYQYEMYASSVNSNVASLASALTGLTITVNSTTEIASLISNTQGWKGDNVGGCITLYGNGYRAMDGVPLENRLLATSNLNSSSPSYTVNPAFGFVFTGADFPAGDNIGALVALGDMNTWYEGYGTYAYGGTVSPEVVDFFFPNSSTTCYLLEEGPYGVGLKENNLEIEISAFPNPTNGTVTIQLPKVEETVEVILYDPSGRTIEKHHFENSQELNLELESAKGTYILEVVTKDYSKQIQLIKT